MSSHHQPGPARRAFAEFARAAVTPSLPALTGTLIVALLPFVALSVTLTPERVSGLPDDALMVDDQDVFGRLTVRALRVKAEAPGGPAVALIGASGLRQSLTGADDLADRIRRRASRDYPVLDLTAGGLRVLEYAAVVEALDPEFRGVVVMAVSPMKLTRARKFAEGAAGSPRLGFRSAAMDAEIRRAGFEPRPVTGIYFLDNLGFFAARPALALRPLSADAGPRVIPERSRMDVDRERAASRDILERYEAEAPEGLARLGRIAAAVPAGARVAFVEAPLNPDLAPGLVSPRFRTRYLADVDRLAEEVDAAHWDLPSIAGLSPGDFKDRFHIRSPAAKERMTGALAARIAGVFREAR